MLRDALDRVAPVGRHAIVIGEALRNGGLLDVPSEPAAFRVFVNGPLAHAAADLLGKEMAKELVAALLDTLLPAPRPRNANVHGTLPLDAQPPSGPGPSPPVGKSKVSSTLGYGQPRKATHEATLPYAGDEPRARLDVAVLTSDAATGEALTEMLEARNYRVLAPKTDNVVALCRELPIRVVLVGTAHHEVLSAILGMGSAAPKVVFLSDEIRTKPTGVLAILPRRVDLSLVEALDVAIRASITS